MKLLEELLNKKKHLKSAVRANLPLDSVAVGEGGFQTVKGVRHVLRLPLARTPKMQRAGSGGQRSLDAHLTAPAQLGCVAHRREPCNAPHCRSFYYSP